MNLPAAVALALASAMAYGAAATLQQREVAHHDIAASGLMRFVVHRPVWWASVAAMGLGALLHVAALGLGPLVLVQPLGVSALVFALVMTARSSGRPLRTISWPAPACVVIGLVAVSSVIARSGPGPSPVGHLWSAYGLVVGIAAGTATAAAATARRRPAGGGILFAVAAALCFGLTSGTVRALWLGEASPLVAVVGLGAAAAGFVLLQRAYRVGGLGAPLATLTLLDPLTAATIGVVAFGEPLPTSLPGLLLGLGGVLLTVLGVMRLSRDDTVARDRPASGTAAPHPVTSGR